MTAVQRAAAPLLAACAAFLAAPAAPGKSPYAELDPRRVEAVAAMLPDKPAGFGRPADDRAFWSAPDTLAATGGAVAQAEALLARTFPPWDNELYLEYSRNGQRAGGEKMIRERAPWLKPAVLAECVENRGRFLPLIHQVLAAHADEPSWTLPAHDGGLGNFRGTRISVDLRSAALAADLAQALYLLGDRVEPALRSRLTGLIARRAFDPIRASLRTGKGTWWLGSKSDPVQNNWNSVCLAGVTGAARTLLPSRADRALFVAASEHYSRYFINGFLDDGFCVEGAGYWHYGFGNFIVLREILMDVTGGKIDLFADPKTRAMALFGARFQLVDRLAPPFADSRNGTRISREWLGYCNRVMRLGLPGTAPADGFLGGALAEMFARATPSAPGDAATPSDAASPRSFFDKAGVLVCRPLPGRTPLAAAIKAGGNGNHSHNDIGSYNIALADQLVTGDPGGPHVYDAQTFSKRRYDRKILNSFGHPVPVVAAKLQGDATRIRPQVISTRFSEEADEIAIDMRPAYAAPELRELVRTMRFDRSGDGAVRVADRVRFERPAAFETAIVTTGTWRRVDATTFELNVGKQTLVAAVEAPGPFAVTSEAITELAAPTFTRIGLALERPVTDATVAVTFRPRP